MMVPAIICDADTLSQVAIIQELGRLGVPVIALAESAAAIGFASKYVTRRIVSPVPSHQAEYVGFLLKSVPRGVLFYSNDGNAEILSAYRQDLRQAGFSLMISDPAVLASVIRKDRLYDTARESGIRVPRCLPVTAADLTQASAEIGYPCILKSTNLAGGVYEMVTGPPDLDPSFQRMQVRVHSAEWQHRRSRLMVQEWIPQTNTILWNFNACVSYGEIAGFSMGRRIRTDHHRDGSIGSALLYGITAFHPGIFEANERLLHHLRFDGIMESEWSENGLDPAALYLYDFNPRPSGNLRWTLKSGVPVVRQYYRLSLGLPLDGRPRMKPGVKYFKIICRQNDFVESLENPAFSAVDRACVFWQNALALTRPGKHAIDILDPSDLGPTLRSARELAAIIRGMFGRFAKRVFSFRDFRQRRGARA